MTLGFLVEAQGRPTTPYKSMSEKHARRPFAAWFCLAFLGYDLMQVHKHYGIWSSL